MTVEAVLPVPVLVGQTSHAVAAVSPLNVPASQSEQSSLPAASVGLNLPASQAVQLLTAPENAPPSHFLGWPVKMWPDAHVKLQMLPLFTLSVHDMVTLAGLVMVVQVQSDSAVAPEPDVVPPRQLQVDKEKRGVNNGNIKREERRQRILTQNEH